MFWTEVKYSNGSDTLEVHGNAVWDYKLWGDELRLISEPVEGSDQYPKVTIAEIFNFLGLFQEVRLISETDRTEIEESQLKVIACN